MGDVISMRDYRCDETGEYITIQTKKSTHVFPVRYFMNVINGRRSLLWLVLRWPCVVKALISDGINAARKEV